MKCYIYSIINIINNDRYVGQTTNFSRRKQEHLKKLRENNHPNPKLQNAWNRYGEDNFRFEYQIFNLTKQELDQKEKDTIQLFDSFNNGYNLTEGGTGGNTRTDRVLDFEKYCFAYFGNKKYKGMLNKTGKYLNVDSSTISALVRDISYDDYRQRALLLSEEQQLKYVQDFEQIFNITINNLPQPNRDKINDDLVVDILCMVSCYTRGIEQAILNKFNLSKGLVFHIVKYGEYSNAKTMYNLMNDEEIKYRGTKKFKEYDIQNYSKFQLKECYKRLI